MHAQTARTIINYRRRWRLFDFERTDAAMNRSGLRIVEPGRHDNLDWLVLVASCKENRQPVITACSVDVNCTNKGTNEAAEPSYDSAASKRRLLLPAMSCASIPPMPSGFRHHRPACRLRSVPMNSHVSDVAQHTCSSSPHQDVYNTWFISFRLCTCVAVCIVTEHSIDVTMCQQWPRLPTGTWRRHMVIRNYCKRRMRRYDRQFNADWKHGTSQQFKDMPLLSFVGP